MHGHEDLAIPLNQLDRRPFRDLRRVREASNILTPKLLHEAHRAIQLGRAEQQSSRTGRAGLNL